MTAANSRLFWRVGAVVGTAATIGLLVISSDIFWPRVINFFRRPAVSYEGVSIGESKQVVEYKLGIPKHVLGSPEYDSEFKGFAQHVFDVDGDPATDKNALKSGESFKAYSYWQYEEPDGAETTVEFDKAGNITTVECVSLSVTPRSCQPVLGIEIGDKESEVIKKIGKPDFYRFDETTKSILYTSLHIELTLQKQRVYLIKISKAGRPS